MNVFKISFALSVYFTLLIPCFSAALTSYVSKEGKVIAIFDGEISAGDTDQLKQIIKKANNSGKIVSGVRLNSPGGSLLESAKLADTIRYAKIATVVPNGSTCASACFVVFAAGTEKFASYSAYVGVHGATDVGGQETQASNAATVGMAKIVKELGVPADIIGRMVVTPPDQIVWLSPDNLRAMGVTMTGKMIQTPTATGPTQLPQISTQNASAPLKWENIVTNAMNVSSEQNGGKPIFARICQPELKTCTMAIHFKGQDEVEMMIRTTEDSDGKLISRDICTFNQFGDIRKCLDWDRRTLSRDMKDAKGNWNQIADQ